MHTRIFVLLSLFVLLATGCGLNLNTVTGSGHVVTENRTVSNFNALTLSGIGEVTITQGETEALTVSAEDNLMPYIRTEVSGNTLVIGLGRENEHVNVRPTQPIKFNLSVKNLNAIELSGAGRIQSASLKSDRFDVHVSGAGDVKIDQLQATDLNSKLTGAGSVDIAGQVTSQNLLLSGIGNYRAESLNSQTAMVTVSGAGGSTLWARDNLDVSISGAGSVSYYGSPKIHQNISGAGSIKSLGSK